MLLVTVVDEPVGVYAAVTVSVYVPLGVPVVVCAEFPPKHAARLIASSAVIATLCASCAPSFELRTDATP